MELSQFKMEREQILSNTEQLNPVVRLTQFASLLDSEPVQLTNTKDEKILQLNDKLILTLEQADAQLQTLSQLNQKLSQDLAKLELDKQQAQSQLQSELDNYRQKEQAEKQVRIDSQLNKLTDKWCDSFAITDATVRDDARKMLSAFSEDKLAMIEGQLSHKLTQMQNVPQPITKQSDELAMQRQVVESRPAVKKQVHDMTPEERKEYSDQLYKTMVASQYKTHNKK